MINKKIQDLKGPLRVNHNLQSIADETLAFLRRRHQFWQTNLSKTSRPNVGQKSSKSPSFDGVIDFNPSNIQFLDDDNPLKEKGEVIEERFQLKKYYDFTDMYDPEPSDEIDVILPPLPVGDPFH